MPRELRIEYPGAMYHVLNRGDQREDIFLDDEDRQKFLATLEQACRKTEWQLHAYCLMRNHFHLVIETPSANLAFQAQRRPTKSQAGAAPQRRDHDDFEVDRPQA